MTVKLVDVNEARETLEQQQEAIYVDVRTEAEFAAGHPTGAVNIPIMIKSETGQLRQNPDFLAVAKAVLRRDQPILCGCKMGGRSQAAANALADEGFVDVTNVVGGYSGGPDPRGGHATGWQEAGLDVSTDVNPQNSYEGLCEKASLSDR